MELLFLGTGTSVGVPMIGCHCAVCDSNDPRNTRRRTSLYVRSAGSAFVIDTPPDFRQQMLDNCIERLDAVLFTHAHADHIFGFDDVRRFNTLSGKVMPAYGDQATLDAVRRAFSYISDKPSPQGFYRPLVDFVPVKEPFTIGDVRLVPLAVEHGESMTGYLMECGGARVGYVPDCRALPAVTLERLKGVDVMILDALRYRPHPAHICIDESLTLLRRIGALRSFLIHLCHDVDHADLAAKLPEGIEVSFDGLRIVVTGGEG